MTFYNNRAAIAHINEEELYLFRNINNQIVMDYYNYNEGNIQETIIKDALSEFDIMINKDNEIYLIYQNIQNDLCLLTINKKVINNITLNQEKLPKIFELNILESLNHTSIIYLVLQSEKEGIFEIHHHILNFEDWVNYHVEDIKIDKLLNPIKILKNKKNIILCYYYENQICIKEFNLLSMEWKESIVLTDNKEKLYLDLLKDGNYTHLIYSEYNNENLRIKYVRHLYDNDSIIKEKEEVLSYEGNPSNSTLIIEDNIIWAIWNESSNLFSRYSLDRGDTWSSTYIWKESRFADITRYKYITNTIKENIILDYAFGTIYPDIKFLGFGPLNKVEEIIPKKKLMEKILPL